MTVRRRRQRERRDAAVEAAPEPALAAEDDTDASGTALRPADEASRSVGLTSAFGPSTPVRGGDMFAGRVEELHRLMAVVRSPGQHALVIGQRSLGKTSLTIAMERRLAEDGVHTARVNCDRGDDYGYLWSKVFSELMDAQLAVVRVPDVSWSESKLRSNAGPDVVRRALRQMSDGAPMVVVLDEFDLVADLRTRSLMADTLKMLSDRLPNVTVVLVGVADTLGDLISRHQSVERALTEVVLKRMTPIELTELVVRGFTRAGMDVDTDAVELLVALSRGLPFYAHLLGRHAGLSALATGQRSVAVSHVRAGAAEVGVVAPVAAAYAKATAGDGDGRLRRVLVAAAEAPLDDLGYFAPEAIEPGWGSQLRDPWVALLSRVRTSGDLRQAAAAIGHHARVRHALDALASEQKGKALVRRAEGGSVRYRFGDPLLQPYVLLRELR